MRAVHIGVRHDDDAVVAEFSRYRTRPCPIPVPRVWIKVTISWEEISLSNRAFSTFSILPFNGKIAWNLRSRPCLAEPPAESPSTM